MSRIYDVSVGVRDGGVTYPGNPAISITAQQAISQGAGANVSRIDFGSHTGTHVDSPKHFFDDGVGVEALALDVLMGPARLLTFDDSVLSVGEEELRTFDLSGVTRVLLKTRNSAWLASGSTEFHKDYTFLAPSGAAYLVSLGVLLVGVDYLSVEQFHSGHHMTHRTLLEAGVIIVEGLVLAEPAAGDYELLCLPVKFLGLDGAPCRAVLRAP
ncbi:MAG: cyclase family protein [Gemmatimonadaceae bacterium]